MKTVIIISKKDDPHSHIVKKRIDQKGGRAYIFDSSKYPTEWQIDYFFGNKGMNFTIRFDETKIRGETIHSVWWRRPENPIVSEDITNFAVRTFVATECRHAFDGFLHSLDNKVYNQIYLEDRASYKPYQLKTAVEVGLKIPKTLVSANSKTIMAFQKKNGRVIFKPFNSPKWSIKETRELTNNDYQYKDSLKYSPTIFQEKINKSHDIRVIMVSGQCFAFKITTKENILDWRLRIDAKREPIDLPNHIVSKLRKLMQKLGLKISAIDMGYEETGDYTFFEVNPSGQWLFNEISTKSPISEAIADVLLS